MFRKFSSALALCALFATVFPAAALDKLASQRADAELSAMLFSHLLPQKHPWAKNPIDYSEEKPWKWTPSFFYDSNAPIEGERRLYVASAEFKRALIVLEADLAEFRGSLEVFNTLIAQLNAVTSGSLRLQKVGKKLHLFFSTSPLDGQATETIEVHERFFRALGKLQLKGSPQVAAVARMFHPRRALYLEMAPPVEEMETDGNTGRKYKFIDNRANLKKYVEALISENCEKTLVNKN